MSITPFDGGGRLDEEALRRHLRYLADGGVGVYLGSYGTGEGLLLRRHEIRRLYEIGVEELKGRTPVYAAALGFTETDYVIELAREAAAIGVDAVQIHPPRPGPAIGQRPDPEEAERFYRDVLEAVTTPVVLSVEMAMHPYDVPVPLLAKLVGTYDQVRAINSTHPDTGYLMRLLEAVGGRVPVYVGFTAQLLTNLALGGKGGLSFEANVAPRLCASIGAAHAAGDYAVAKERFAHLLRLNAALLAHATPRAAKAALNLLGLSGGLPRRPYLPVDEAAQPALARALDELGIREIEGIA
jgi:4-hydroxy-tetrahydrodipicolinate synthase